jgi:hypothetical protein
LYLREAFQETNPLSFSALWIRYDGNKQRNCYIGIICKKNNREYLDINNLEERDMKKQEKSNLRILILLTLILIFLLIFPVRRHIYIYLNKTELDNKQETFVGSSTELQKTIILPTLNLPIVPNRNNVWCSSFQLSWNEMMNKVIKEPINISGAEELSQRLNNSKQKNTDLSDDSYYVGAGKVSDGIIEKIKGDMASRFPSAQLPQFNPDDGFIAYSYVETYLKFTESYRQNEKALVFTDSSGNETFVKSFGVWEGYLPQYEPLCKQMEVLYCELDENRNVIEFALDLCKDTKPYQVVVSIIKPKKSLELTFNELQTKIRDFESNPENEYLREFSDVDILKVPEMFWRITHHFQELEDKSLLNPEFKDMPISTAMQVINFRLDRSGVILKSHSLFSVAAVPRLFIFDKPFLIYLKKRDAEQPFFVMWVDNAELLSKFENSN